MIALVLAAAFTAAFDGTLEFDGHAPVSATNFSFVSGVSGKAVHMPEDGWLEYAFDPAYLKAEEGTISVWLRQDRDFDGGYLDRDRNLAADGTWTDRVNSSPNMRPVFGLGEDGGISLDAGVFLRGQYVHHASCMECEWNRRVYGGEWHHVALTFSRNAARARLYLDGILLRELDAIGRFDKARFPRTFRVGCGGVARTRARHPSFGGDLDGLRLSPREVTGEEILGEFAEGIPYRLELLDWSVVSGETRKVRFRVRNLAKAKVTRELRFSNGERIRFSLAPGALEEFTVPVVETRPGVFRLTVNADAADYRVFELYCLGRDDPALRPDGKAVGKATLVGEYDCTRDYPSNVFNECGSVIVTNACGAYRECTTIQCGVGFMYRFEIRNRGKPHRLEIDFPDDAKREYSFAVYPENFGHLNLGSLDCAGILTGVDQPLSMRMQRKELVFWPDSPAIAAAVIGFVDRPGTHPPAVARLRLYELDGLPVAPRVGAEADRRSVGVWDEDPTMDSLLAVSRPFNCLKLDLGFWHEKWARTLDYMRYQGLDAWTIKAMSYAGDVTAMNATLEHDSQWMSTGGRVCGWAELGADMLDRAGMDIWVHYNHKSKYNGWFGRLGGLKDNADVFFHDILGGPMRGGEQVNDINFIRPEVREAYRRVIRAYRDKFKVYRHFRGISLNESPGIAFGHLQNGYDGFTLSRFASDTGIDVKGATARERYEYLCADPGRRAAWIAWRCRQVTDFVRELVETLREDGGAYELQYWAWCSYFTAHGSDWFGWDPDASLKEAGVDLRALAGIKGLRVLPCVRPDRFRGWGDYDSNEYHFPYDERYRSLLREAGIKEVNLYRHSNMEIWTGRCATSNCWKRPFWTTIGTGFNVNRPRFYDFATPHPVSKYALESMAGLVADYDLQDFMHGFWGLPEVGEHERFRKFYTEFRAIPRGRYELAPGPNDPVAFRTGAKGYYLVNREAYPVEVSWTENGAERKAALGGSELRWVDAPPSVRIDVVTCRIPDAERKILSDRLATLRKRIGERPDDAALSDISTRAERAFAAGRYTETRGYLWTAPARAALFPEAIKPDARKVVKAKVRGTFDPDSACGYYTYKWSLIKPRDEYWPTVNRIAATGERVECAYSVGVATNGLHIYARCLGGRAEKLTVAFDPLNNGEKSYYPGRDPDDVVFVVANVEKRSDQQVGFSLFVPFAALRGFKPGSGAQIGFNVLYSTVMKDASGEFPITIGYPRGVDYPGEWPRLQLP